MHRLSSGSSRRTEKNKISARYLQFKEDPSQSVADRWIFPYCNKKIKIVKKYYYFFLKSVFFSFKSENALCHYSITWFSFDFSSMFFSGLILFFFCFQIPLVFTILYFSCLNVQLNIKKRIL